MAVDVLDERGVSLTLQLLAETREELHRAEGKAAMLFAIFGIGFGAVLAGIIAGDWKPSDLAAGAEVALVARRVAARRRACRGLGRGVAPA